MATAPAGWGGAPREQAARKRLEVSPKLARKLLDMGFPKEDLEKLDEHPRRDGGLLHALRRDLLGG